jgi:hypothetical protein
MAGWTARAIVVLENAKDALIAAGAMELAVDVGAGAGGGLATKDDSNPEAVEGGGSWLMFAPSSSIETFQPI